MPMGIPASSGSGSPRDGGRIHGGSLRQSVIALHREICVDLRVHGLDPPQVILRAIATALVSPAAILARTAAIDLGHSVTNELVLTGVLSGMVRLIAPVWKVLSQ